MGFFKNILNKIRGKGQEAHALPAELELIPGELWVKVAVHQIPNSMGNNNLSALSFLTVGMMAHQQQEFFFVLKTNKTGIDDVPQEPLYFFQQVYGLAKQGYLAKEGSISQFGEKDLWGWKGILYAKAPAHLYKSVPVNTLAMVLLSLEELQAVQDFGYSRVLSMLGKQSRYYPFPYWTDHFRDNLLLKEVQSKSILKNVRRMVLPDASVTKIDQHLYLKIEKSAVLGLGVEEFPSKIPIAILPSLATECDACLTWSYRTNAPEAITIPNSKAAVMGGCMLMLIAEQDKNLARILEDGFALMLTNKDWKAFWKAIQQQEMLSIKTEESSLDFSLIWV